MFGRIFGFFKSHVDSPTTFLFSVTCFEYRGRIYTVKQVGVMSHNDRNGSIRLSPGGQAC